MHVVRRSDNFWAGLSTDLIIEQVLMRSIKTSGGLTRGRGMTEIQRSIWLMSMPACSHMNEAMQHVTGVQYTSSEQTKEVSMARKERDRKDIMSLLRYLETHDTFISEEDSMLFNTANGVSADSNVNVDQAKEIGMKILDDMDGQNVATYTFRKKNQVITMGKKTAIPVGNDYIQIDPQLLFQRLITAGERCGELPLLFRFEMCAYPPALFDSPGSMKTSSKSILADALWNTVGEDLVEIPDDVSYVLDGGALLHRIPWTQGVTFGEITDSYVKYVTMKHGSRATIIFDGYQNGPSTKDQTHQRRAKDYKGALVNFTLDMRLNMKKEVFLSNNNNKDKFLKMLSSKLQESGYTCIQASADADVLIAQTAVRLSSHQVVVVIADDTDILVLLLHHAIGVPIYLHSNKKRGPSNPPRVWNIRNARKILGEKICRHILFIHAFLGCDTTCIGKAVVLKIMLKGDVVLEEQAEVFSKQSTADEVVSAGETALIYVCKGSLTDTLDKLRYKKFGTKVAASTVSVKLETLPPTSSAMRYHSMRTYYQVQEWMGNQDISPENWGWFIDNGAMVPKQSDMEAAPRPLLDVIHCNCKSDCSTNRCGCRKHGLECSVGCGECRGVSCSNALCPIIDETPSLDFDVQLAL